MNQIRPPSTAQSKDSPSSAVADLLREAEARVESQTAKALELLEGVELIGLDPADQAQARWLHAKCLIRMGQLEEARPILGQAVEVFDETTHPSRISCRADFGRLLRDMGDLIAAKDLLDATLNLTQATADLAAEANVLNLSATVRLMLGEPIEASQRLMRVMQLRLVTNDLHGQATALINLGAASNEVGDYGSGLEQLSQAYRIVQDLKDHELESLCLINIGATHLLLEQPEKAIEFFEQAVQTSRLQRRKLNEFLSITKLAEAHHTLGNHDLARTLLQSCLAEVRQTKHRFLETTLLAWLGKTHVALGEIPTAQDFFAQALKQAQETSDSDAHLDALMGLAESELKQQHHSQAIEHLHQALELAEQVKNKRSTAQAHQMISQAFETIDPIRALKHFKSHHRLEREILNEETTRKTKNLGVQLDLERSRHEAETYRLRTQAFEEANAMLEQKVQARTQELEEARLEVVMRLAVAAEYRDDHTGEHTHRVGHSSALIAEELGLPSEEVSVLRLAARLHDVGKIGISDLIMLKPAKLTVEEFERMKTHTLIGAQILSGGKTTLLTMAETIALTHHEHWDGRGYPSGLAGEDIPLAGRIVAVADVFDALTSARPYKNAWTAAEAQAEIEAKKGTQFEPRIVDAFVTLLKRGLKLDAQS